jgi:hypothetical protein
MVKNEPKCEQCGSKNDVYYVEEAGEALCRNCRDDFYNDYSDDLDI